MFYNPKTAIGACIRHVLSGLFSKLEGYNPFWKWLDKACNLLSFGFPVYEARITQSHI